MNNDQRTGEDRRIEAVDGSHPLRRNYRDRRKRLDPTFAATLLRELAVEVDDVFVANRLRNIADGLDPRPTTSTD